MKAIKFTVDQKYVSNYFDFVVILPLVKEELEATSLLLMMLLERSKNYATKGKISEKLDEFYGAGFAISHTIFYDKLIITFSGYVLDEKYIEKEIFDDYLRFVHEIVYDQSPKRFRSQEFRVVRKNAITYLKQIYESPVYISNYGFLEALDANSILATSKYGKIKNYRKVTLEDLRMIHQKIVATPGYFIGIGPKKASIATQNLHRYFHLTNQSLKIKSIPLKGKVPCEKWKGKDIKQSIITIGYKLDNNEYKNYAKGIFNFMVGGGGVSKLFTEIREKRGLCYSVSSRIDPMTNLMIITLGVDKQRINEALMAIKEVMENLEFIEHDFLAAKQLFLNDLISSFDSQKKTTQGYLIRSLRRNATSLKQIQQILEKNTLATMNQIAQGVQYMGYYVLEGTKNE